MRSRAGTLAAVASCLLLAACGGNEGEAPAPDEPALSARVAERLAARSDGIADLLAAGETCAAAHEADALQAAALQAIDAGEVPSALQEPLEETVNELVDEINCPPPPEDEGEDEEDDDNRGKGKGDGNGKGKEDKDDDKDGAGETTTTTTTEGSG